MHRFGVYETLVDLGRGGLADLYLARAASDPTRLVVLKTLRLPVTERRATLFVDEARLGLLLEHPNIVRTLETGEEQGRPFMTLEFLHGQPLDRVLDLRRVQDSRDVELRKSLVWCLTEALEGLHHAHELSSGGSSLAIVHRDFSPHNVFVTYDARVKVLDFGIAKATGRMYRTSANEFKGKLRYMAPEQALGLRVDRRADIFSAGTILREICSGDQLWTREMSDREVFDDLVGGAYPIDVPGEAGAMNVILHRALARDASERYATAREMRDDLLRQIAPDDLRETTTQVMAELFRDQRARTETMLASALDMGR